MVLFNHIVKNYSAILSNAEKSENRLQTVLVLVQTMDTKSNKLPGLIGFAYASYDHKFVTQNCEFNRKKLIALILCKSNFCHRWTARPIPLGTILQAKCIQNYCHKFLDICLKVAAVH
jgi:hypothetical protein